MGKEESMSPTLGMESKFLACIINTHEQRDTMSVDVPNAFLQAIFPRESGEDRTIVKISRRLVDMLANVHPETHEDCAVVEKGKQVLHVETSKTLCRMLEAVLPWHGKFRGDLKEAGFVFDLCDPCVAK